MCVIFNSATAQSFVTVRLVIALDPLLSTACQNSSPAIVWRLGQRSSEGKHCEGEDSDGPWTDSSRGKSCCDSDVMGKVMLLGLTVLTWVTVFFFLLFFFYPGLFLFAVIFFPLCASGDGVGHHCLGHVVRVTSILTSIACPPPSHCWPDWPWAVKFSTHRLCGQISESPCVYIRVL